MSLVEQKLLTRREHLGSPPVFSGVRVIRSLVLCVMFVDRCLSFCPFSVDHCVVCLFLLAIVLSVFFCWPLCCLSFSVDHCVVCLFLLTFVLSVDLLILITPLESSNSSYEHPKPKQKRLSYRKRYNHVVILQCHSASLLVNILHVSYIISLVLTEQ